MKWQAGRQQSGYYKMPLLILSWPIKFDLYLLKFPEGCKIISHKDEVKSGKHYRLNIILKRAKEGGNFICDDTIFETGRIKLFRPDIRVHEVTEVIKGTRYLLSLGWIKNKKEKL